ncbi:stress protein [Paenibacillus sp. HJL G12]|uniref:Stress protein n=1 Tax=Paenibacillus dendrobii TaxID=2691084 RepID=A0A7X3IDY5_9BACL|nr:stress protein [Paenibacillus dendrobii]
MQLKKGQRIMVTKENLPNRISFFFGWNQGSQAMSIDAAAFLLSSRNRCEQDEDFIFYGHPQAPNGSVEHVVLKKEDQEVIHVSLAKLSDDIAKIAFTVTIYDGEALDHRMKDITGMYLRIVNTDLGEELYRFEYGSDLSLETAVVVGELYRHHGEWKWNAIGSGFEGGMAALCINYGLELEGSTQEPEVAVSMAMEAPTISPIDLRKKLVQITLEKKRMTDVAARVGIVLDISGSMQRLYRNGTVQDVLERILAVACKFDDNGSLDVWIYDNEFRRLPSVTEKDFHHYVTDHILNNASIHKFGRNNEVPVMEDVIRKYTVEEDSELPAFIIFINDGGVVKAIRKIITAAAVQPIFWQFVGIGESDFEVLKRLDTMEGRVVDNANFMHLNDFKSISDEELYDRLLNEFPSWLKEAALKRIIRM